MDGFNLGSVVAHIRADTTQFMTGIDQALTGMKSLSGGAIAAAGAITAVVAAAGAAFSIKEATEFNKQMTLVQTQAGASRQEVEKMSKAILDLGGTVTQTPIELAQALFHIESSGYRGAQALDILKIAAEGATTGNANLEDVTNALVAAEATNIKGLGDTSNAMGVLNAIVGSGNMRMADLTAALSTGVLPAAKSFGLSIQDVGAALDTMTINGVPANEAATRLRMTFSLLGAPSSKAAKSLDEIGLSAEDLAHTMRDKGLIPALTELHDHLINSGKDATEQAAIISHAFGGGRTSAGILTLLNNLDTMQKSFDNIKSTTGNFSDNVAAALDTPAAKFDILKAQIQTIAIEIGDKLLPAVVKVLDVFLDFVKVLEKMSPVTKNILEWVGAFAAAIVAITAATRLWAIAQGILNLIFALNPIVLIITLIIAAGIMMITHWKTVSEFAGRMWHDVSDFFERMWHDVSGFTIRIWQDVSGFVERLYRDVVGFFERMWHDVSDFAERIWHDIPAFFEHLPYEIGFILGRITRILFDWVTLDIPRWYQNIVDWFSKLPGEIWNWMVQVWQNITKMWDQIYASTTNTVSNIFHSIVDWFSKLPNEIWGWLENLYNNVVHWWQSLNDSAKTAGKNFFDGFVDTIKKIPGEIVNLGSVIISRIEGWASGVFDKAKEVAGKIWSGFKDGLGIKSPSYIEKALVSIGKQSKDTLNQLAADVASFSTLSGRIGSNTLSSGNMVQATASITNQINGPINIGSQQDADYFFGRLVRNQELANQGMTSIIGSLG